MRIPLKVFVEQGQRRHDLLDREERRSGVLRRLKSLWSDGIVRMFLEANEALVLQEFQRGCEQQLRHGLTLPSGEVGGQAPRCHAEVVDVERPYLGELRCAA